MDILDLNPDLLPVGASPLHLAVNNNDVTALKHVLESNRSSLNKPDNHGRTPLVVALQNGRFNAAFVLIQNGARVDVPYDPPYRMSVSNALSRPIFSVLVNSLIENDIVLSFVPHSTLTLAAYSGKTDIVRKIVLQYGVPVNYIDNLCRTALHYASQQGDLGTVSCLIQLGASHVVTDLSGSTPLHVACAAGHPSVVCALLEDGSASCLQSLDACQRTPAHVALYKKHFDILLFLVANFKGSLDLSQVDKNGHSLQSLMFTFRCQLGAVPSPHNCTLPCLSKEEASWLLFEAVSHQDSRLVSFSLSQGASVNTWDYLQQTPLLFASKLKSLEICRELIQHGADPSISDPGGKTPLQYAAEHDNLSLVEYLLSLPSVDPRSTYLLYARPLSAGLISVFVSFYERNRHAPKPSNWQKWLCLAAPYANRDDFMAFSEAICPKNWCSQIVSCFQSDEEDVSLVNRKWWPTLSVYDRASASFKTLACKRGCTKPHSYLYKDEAFSFTRKPMRCFYPVHEIAFHGNADVFDYVLSLAGNQNSVTELLEATDGQGRTVLSIAARDQGLCGVLDKFYLTALVTSKLEEEYSLPDGVTFEEALLHFFFSGGMCHQPNAPPQQCQTPLAKWPLWYIQRKVTIYCQSRGIELISYEEEDQKRLSQLILECSRPSMDSPLDKYPCLLYTAVKMKCVWGIQLLLSYKAQPTAQHSGRFALVEATKQLQVDVIDLFLQFGFNGHTHSRSPDVVQLSLSIVPALVTLVNSGYVQIVQRLCEVLPITEQLWKSPSASRLLYVTLAMQPQQLGSCFLKSFLAFFCGTIASWTVTESALQSNFLSYLKRLQSYVAVFSSHPDRQVKQIAQLLSLFKSYAVDDPSVFFHQLCGLGYHDLVQLLLENGGACLVNVLDCLKRSPLFFAACGGHLAIVKSLLDEAAIVSSDISTPPIIGLLLYLACAPRSSCKPVNRFLRYATGSSKYSMGYLHSRNVLLSRIKESFPSSFLHCSMAYEDSAVLDELVRLLMPPLLSNWFTSQCCNDESVCIHPLLLIASIPNHSPNVVYLLEAILSNSSQLHCELSPVLHVRDLDYTLLDAAIILAPSRNDGVASELFEDLLTLYTPECQLDHLLLAATKDYWRLLEAASADHGGIRYPVPILKLAVKQGRLDAVHALAPNITTESSEPLELAIKENHLNIVPLLLNKACVPLSALEAAFRYNRKEAFELLWSSLSDSNISLNPLISTWIHVAILNRALDMIKVLLALFRDSNIVVCSDFVDHSLSFWFLVLMSATKTNHEDMALQALACIPESQIKEVRAHRKYSDIIYWSCYWGMAALLECIPFTKDDLFERLTYDSPWECAVANGHLGKLSYVQNFPSVPDSGDWLRSSLLNAIDDEDIQRARLDFCDTLTTGSFHKLCSHQPPLDGEQERLGLVHSSFFNSQSLISNAVVAGIPHAVWVVLEHMGKFAGDVVKLLLQAGVPLVHMACNDGGNHDILELLLKALFEAHSLEEVLSAHSYKGYLALPWAVKNGAVKCVETLLRCSPSSVLYFEQAVTGNSLLNLAVLSGKSAVVDLVLNALDSEAPDSCFATNKTGEYPLYLAFALGCYKIAALLLTVAKKSTKWQEFYDEKMTKARFNWRLTAKLANGWFRALMEQPLLPSSSEPPQFQMNMRAPKTSQSLFVSCVKTRHTSVVKSLLTASCGYIIDQSMLCKTEEILVNAAVLEAITANKDLLGILQRYDATSLLCRSMGSGKTRDVILLLKLVNTSQLPFIVQTEEVLNEACKYSQLEIVQFLLSSHTFSEACIQKSLEVCICGSAAYDLAAYLQIHSGVSLNRQVLPPGYKLSPVVRSVFLDDLSYYSLLERLFISLSGSQEEHHSFAVAWLTHKWSTFQFKLVEEKTGSGSVPGNPWSFSIRNGADTHTISVSIDWDSFTEVLLGTTHLTSVPFPLFVEAVLFSPAVLGQICSADNPRWLAGLFSLDLARDKLPSSVILTCVCWPDEPRGSSTDGHSLLVISYSPEDQTFFFPSSMVSSISEIRDNSGISMTTSYSSIFPEYFRNLATYISMTATTASQGKYNVSVELSPELSCESDSGTFSALYQAVRRTLYDVCEVLQLIAKPAVLYSSLVDSCPEMQRSAFLSRSEPVFSSVLARVSLQESEREHTFSVKLNDSTLQLNLSIFMPDRLHQEPPSILHYEDIVQKVTNCLLAAELEVLKDKITQVVIKDVAPMMDKALKTNFAQADSSSVLVQDKLGEVRRLNELNVEHLILLKSYPQLRKVLFIFLRMLEVLKYKPMVLSSARHLFEAGFMTVVSECTSTGFCLKDEVPHLTFSPADARKGKLQKNLLGIFTSFSEAVCLSQPTVYSSIAKVPAPFVCYVNLEHSRGLLYPVLKSQGLITINLVDYTGQCLSEFPNTVCVLCVAVKSPSLRIDQASSSTDPSYKSASKELIVRAQINGRFVIEWTPVEEGIHYLSFTLNGTPIFGSPVKSFVPGSHEAGAARDNTVEFGPKHWAWVRGSDGSRHTTAGSPLVFIASHSKCECTYSSPPLPVVLNAKKPVQGATSLLQAQNDDTVSPVSPKAVPRSIASSYSLLAASALSCSHLDPLTAGALDERVHYITVCSGSGISSGKWTHIPTNPIVVFISRDTKSARTKEKVGRMKKHRRLQDCFQVHSLPLGNNLHRVTIASTLAGTFKVFAACSVCQAAMHVIWEDKISLIPQSLYILPGPLCPIRSEVSVNYPPEKCASMARCQNTGNPLGKFTAGTTVHLYVKARDRYGNAHNAGSAILQAVIDGAGKREFHHPNPNLQDIIALQSSHVEPAQCAVKYIANGVYQLMCDVFTVGTHLVRIVDQCSMRRSIGTIQVLSGMPSAWHSSLESSNNYKATEGERYSIHLHVFDTFFNPCCEVDSNRIQASIAYNQSNRLQSFVVQQSSDRSGRPTNTFTLSVTPIFHGKGELHVRVSGEYVSPCPLEINITPVTDSLPKKLRNLREYLSHYHGAGSTPTITIDRRNILESAIHEIHQSYFDRTIRVRFGDELGIDAGGVSREFFHLLCREFVNPQYALFHCVGGLYRPSPQSSVNPNHLFYFNFFGKVLAKTICDGHQTNVRFTPAVYKYFLQQKCDLDDLKVEDPPLHSGLLAILNADSQETLEQLTVNFTASRSNFGSMKTVELEHGGEQRMVTMENREEFLNKLFTWHLIGCVQGQLDSLRHGFQTLIPAVQLSNFTCHELEVVLSGQPTIDLEFLRSRTVIAGFPQGHKAQIVQWLWEVLECFSQEQRCRFLQFTTGCACLPTADMGQWEFQIKRGSDDPSLLPVASTCFNCITIPSYPSKETLQQKLELAISYGCQSFMLY